MSNIDFFILFSTLIFISLFGAYKNYSHKSIKSYFLGNNKMSWGTVGISVMLTQATAITFLSTPGQGFASGMSFIQNYFGLPLALIVVCIFFIPTYFNSKVTTAYEYLENRFNLKIRILTSFLFLLQRGFQCGLTIYAPSIILTTILGWNLSLTIICVGILVIIYTVIGGSKAVSFTQKQQMTIILIGMVFVFYYLLKKLSVFASFNESLQLAGLFNKTNAITFSVDPSERYTVWTGLLGGFFLSLSYFGTDQSQVLRYINAKNIDQSRMGLIFNAILKIPMQFFILLLGVLLFVFYLFYTPPIHFNKNILDQYRTSNSETLTSFESSYDELYKERKDLINNFLENDDEFTKEKLSIEILEKSQKLDQMKKELETLMVSSGNKLKNSESDYVFISFILDYLPVGFVGLLIAVILSAAMSSTSAEITALSSISTIDFYKRLINSDAKEVDYIKYSKLFTLLWGLLSITFALLLITSENLIESINIVASLFYGNILGIFLVAFFTKKVKSNNVLYSAILSQLLVLILFILSKNSIIEIGYLWFNLIGGCSTIILSIIFYKINEYFNYSSE